MKQIKKRSYTSADSHILFNSFYWSIETVLNNLLTLEVYFRDFNWGFITNIKLKIH